MKKLFFSFLLITICSPIFSQTIDEKEVAATVELIRKAMVDGDRAILEAYTHANLNYGHSNNKIENKAEYVDAIVSGTNNFSTIELSKLTIQVSGKNAVVRHTFVADYTMAGVAGHANIGVLQVYQKNGKKWLLLARQAVKLAP